MLKEDEIGMTGLAARTLDRLVFPDKVLHKGGCIHQLVSRKRSNTAETADFGMVKFKCHYPYNVSEWDGKKMDLPHAMRESSTFHYYHPMAHEY